MQPETSPDDTDAPVVLLRPAEFERHMRRRGYTTKVAMAEAIGCSRSHLYDLINRVVEPRNPYSRRIVQVTGAKPAKLFELADS